MSRSKFSSPGIVCRGVWLYAPTILMILLVLALAACGEKSIVRTVQQTPTTLPTPTVTPEVMEGLSIAELSAPSNGGMVVPQLAGIDGGLLISKGNKLYLVRLGADEPIVIAEDIVPDMVEPSPDNRAVAYAAGVTDRRENSAGEAYDHFEYRLTVMDLDTLDSLSLIAVGSADGLFATLLGWSPDDQTVLVWNDGAIIANRTDGSNLQALAGMRTAAWLPDNSVLIFAPEVPAEPGSPLAVFRADADFGQRERVDTPVTVPDFLDLADELAALGFVYEPSTLNDFHRAAPLGDGSWAYIAWSDAVRNQTAPVCETWQIRQTTTPDALYTSNSTTFLSDLTVLPDGSLLFLKWDGCRETRDMVVELLRLVPGHVPVEITGDIDPGAMDDANAISGSHARKYAVTPDGRYVFWIGWGDVEGVSLLNVTDLDEGITAPLLADLVLPEGGGRFAGVYWIPPPVEGG